MRRLGMLCLGLLLGCGRSESPSLEEMAPLLDLDLVVLGPEARHSASLDVHGYKEGLMLSGAGSLTYDFVAPPSAALTMAFGVSTGAGCVRVTLEEDGQPAELLFVRAFGLFDTPAMDVHRVPLGHAGAAVRLTFELRPADPASRFSCLIGPRISVPGSVRTEPHILESAWSGTEFRFASAPRSAVPSDPPSAMVYLMDALRADDLSGYGNLHPTSPHLDKISRGGAILASNFSQAPNTPPSVKAILTGRYLPSTGHSVLPDEEDTLAEIFLRASYRTGAFSNTPFVGSAFGTAQGFETLDTSLYVPPLALNDPHPPTKVFAETLAKAIAAWLGSLHGARFFAYAHAVHPHNPYHTAPPYDRLLCDPPAGTPYDGTTATLLAVKNGKIPLDVDALSGYHRLLYDEDVAYDDLAIGKIVATLRALGLEDKTDLAFIADHGDEFLDHAGLLHGFTAYDELLAVPLVLAGPGIPRGGVVRGLTQSIDLAATLLDLAGIDPPGRLEGRTLLPLLRGEGQPAQEVYASASSAPGIFSIRTARWKYVWAPGRATPSAPPKAGTSGRHGLPAISLFPGRRPGMGEGPGRTYEERYLFDLDADPREQKNVVASHPILVELLHGRLLSWLRVVDGGGKGAVPRKSVMSEEDCQRLVALGYVGDGHCGEGGSGE